MSDAGQRASSSRRRVRYAASAVLPASSIARSYAARASALRPEPAEQVGAGGVEGVVAVERLGERVDLGERHVRAVELGHRDRRG